MPAGRPPLFKTAEELEGHIKFYFEKPETKPTITGLAYYLGFESRQSFYDYEKDGEFSYTIKRARLRIEGEYEKALHGTSPTGAIFALKNFGWKDKQEIDQNTSITGRIEHEIDYSKLSVEALREIAALESEKIEQNKNFQNEQNP